MLIGVVSVAKITGLGAFEVEGRSASWEMLEMSEMLGKWAKLQTWEMGALGKLAIEFQRTLHISAIPILKMARQGRAPGTFDKCFRQFYSFLMLLVTPGTTYTTSKNDPIAIVPYLNVSGNCLFRVTQSI